jgi:hypothetical protein
LSYSLEHTYLGSFSLINIHNSTNRNHITQITPNPCHSFLFLKPLEIVLSFPSSNDLPNFLLFLSVRFQNRHFAMKFKNDASVSSEKKDAAQRETGSSAPKMVKPLSTIPPPKPMKKTAEKSSSKKKRTAKKGESKVALTMTDLYDKEIPSKVVKEDTSSKTAAVGEKDTKLSSDVATPIEEKGNPVSTHNSVETGSGEKLGLDVLNDAIESTENMGVSNPDNEIGGDDSVENAAKETLGQENVEPDVSTSMGQPAKPSDEEGDVSDDKVPSVESDRIVEEEGSDSGDDSRRNDAEAVESVKDVVDVDKLNLEDVPQAQTLGDSMAKRLRSNKGKDVPSASKTSKKTDTTVTGTPKRRTKSAGVGPKKGWSKVMVKATAGIRKEESCLFK